ncbi:MAG: hypothetical protein ACI865_000166 [Flavobacteriaceae bacterium]|jgi:hypothetical protein
MRYLVFALFSLIVSQGFSQSFPEGWEGHYSGEMHIGYADRDGDTLAVDFVLEEIVNDSSWTYTLTFHSDKFGEIVKDYIIRRADGSTRDYILDEQDGIEIEMSLMNNCLYTSFEVLAHQYTTALYKMQDDLFFDLTVISTTPTKTTSSEKDEDDNSFEVKSYKPTQHQSVYLTRN